MTALLQQLETLHAKATPPWTRIGSDQQCRLAVEAVNLLPRIIAVMKAAEGMRGALQRAATLAGIAYDWNLGDDGRIEVDGEWISCSDLGDEFNKQVDAYELAVKGAERE